MKFKQIDDKRIEPRYAFPKTIEYTTGPDSGQHKGVIINISKSGICLYMYETHGKGQTITIKSNLPVEPRTAAIRWVKEVSDGFYQTGLQFVQHEPLSPRP